MIKTVRNVVKIYTFIISQRKNISLHFENVIIESKLRF